MDVHDKRLLVNRIEKAWSGVAYPGDEHIFTPDSYDDEDITAYFCGTTWRGHTAEALRAHCSAISVFFTPVAFHYWLAAYLIAAVEEPETLSQGTESLVSSFSPRPRLSGSRSQKNARLALFSKEQLSVVIGVIEYLERWGTHPIYPEWTMEERETIEHIRTIHDALGA